MHFSYNIEIKQWKLAENICARALRGFMLSRNFLSYAQILMSWIEFGSFIE